MTREPFINSRLAARFVGYEVGEGPAGSEPGLRAFYHWVKTNRVPTHRRGPCTLLFRVSELEAAITRHEQQDDAPDASLTKMEALAREHVQQFRERRLRVVAAKAQP